MSDGHSDWAKINRRAPRRARSAAVSGPMNGSGNILVQRHLRHDLCGTPVAKCRFGMRCAFCGVAGASCVTCVCRVPPAETLSTPSGGQVSIILSSGPEEKTCHDGCIL